MSFKDAFKDAMQRAEKFKKDKKGKGKKRCDDCGSTGACTSGCECDACSD